MFSMFCGIVSLNEFGPGRTLWTLQIPLTRHESTERDAETVTTFGQAVVHLASWNITSQPIELTVVASEEATSSSDRATQSILILLVSASLPSPHLDSQGRRSFNFSFFYFLFCFCTFFSCSIMLISSKVQPRNSQHRQ